VATNMNQFEDKYKNGNFRWWTKEENNSRKTGETFMENNDLWIMCA
jgi:hypothetical protein